jgi:hypothetical protein
LGDLFVFRHDPNPVLFDEIAASENAPTLKLARAQQKKVRAEVAKRYLISKLELPAPIRGTPAVVGGRLYVAMENSLLVLGKR